MLRMALRRRAGSSLSCHPASSRAPPSPTCGRNSVQDMPERQIPALANKVLKERHYDSTQVALVTSAAEDVDMLDSDDDGDDDEEGGVPAAVHSDRHETWIII